MLSDVLVVDSSLLAARLAFLAGLLVPDFCAVVTDESSCFVSDLVALPDHFPVTSAAAGFAVGFDAVLVDSAVALGSAVERVATAAVGRGA